MPRIKVRPWRDRNELLDVRTKLYLPDVEESVAARRDAADMIEIWRRRARLPHAIESTALLVEAQLHQRAAERTEGGSTYAVRAAYATALARFVTGFTDINQPTVAKRSMFDVAADLRIPEQWVELRHQFTHGGELPTLAPLERAVEGALEWLWEAFWKKLGDEADEKGMTGATDDEGKSKSMEMKVLLKEYVKKRRGEVQMHGVDVVKEGSQVAGEMAERILRAVDEDSAGTEILLSPLVDEFMIVPSNHNIGNSLSGAFMLWDPLLLQLATQLRSFLVDFVLRILSILTPTSSLEESQDPQREALNRWIEHIFLSKAWVPRRRLSKDGLVQLRKEVIQECILSPHKWTSKLAERLVVTGGKAFREQWQDTIRAISVKGDNDELEGNDLISDEDVEMLRKDPFADSSHANADGISAKDVSDVIAFSSADYGGWKPYPGVWSPVPIGAIEGEDER